MGSDRLRMLRLGRGEGFRAALRAGPSASDDILACVLADPTRSVGGPLSVIAHHLRVPAVPDDLSAQSTRELLANPAPGTRGERAAILASRRDPETKRLIAAAADTGDELEPRVGAARADPPRLDCVHPGRH